jgi:hypothetical protein
MTWRSPVCSRRGLLGRAGSLAPLLLLGRFLAPVAAPVAVLAVASSSVLLEAEQTVPPIPAIAGWLDETAVYDPGLVAWVGDEVGWVARVPGQLYGESLSSYLGKGALLFRATSSGMLYRATAGWRTYVDLEETVAARFVLQAR